MVIRILDECMTNHKSQLIQDTENKIHHLVNIFYLYFDLFWQKYLYPEFKEQIFLENLCCTKSMKLSCSYKLVFYSQQE